MSAPALVLDSVSHTYGAEEILDRVSFTVAPGEIVCLLGPSGCGKTTTLRLVAGLETPSAGRIAIGGNCVSEPDRMVPPERRRVTLMFQDYALFPHLRVWDNVAFALRNVPRSPHIRIRDGVAFALRSVPRRMRRKRAETLLAQVGMGAHADSYPHMLSGGEQQRVALARALAPEPVLVLLDEPFSDLDPELRGRVRDDTLHLLKTNGASALLVTHDPEEAMAMADRLVVMREGRIEQDGAPEEIYCRPASPFVAAFLGEVNRFRGVADGGRVRTPLGPVPADGVPEGGGAQVLVRPEAILIGDPADGGAEAEVEAVRMLGRSTLVHMTLAEGDRRHHLHVRVPGRFHAREGERRHLSLDGGLVFVFPER